MKEHQINIASHHPQAIIRAITLTGKEDFERRSIASRKYNAERLIETIFSKFDTFESGN